VPAAPFSLPASPCPVTRTRFVAAGRQRSKRKCRHTVECRGGGGLSSDKRVVCGAPAPCSCPPSLQMVDFTQLSKSAKCWTRYLHQCRWQKLRTYGIRCTEHMSNITPTVTSPTLSLHIFHVSMPTVQRSSQTLARRQRRPHIILRAHTSRRHTTPKSNARSSSMLANGKALLHHL
jgi:hypothetical protein